MQVSEDKWWVGVGYWWKPEKDAAWIFQAAQRKAGKKELIKIIITYCYLLAAVLLAQESTWKMWQGVLAALHQWNKNYPQFHNLIYKSIVISLIKSFYFFLPPKEVLLLYFSTTPNLYSNKLVQTSHLQDNPQPPNFICPA